MYWHFFDTFGYFNITFLKSLTCTILKIIECIYLFILFGMVPQCFSLLEYFNALLQVLKDKKTPFLMSGCKVADGYGTMLVCIFCAGTFLLDFSSLF